MTMTNGKIRPHHQGILQGKNLRLIVGRGLGWIGIVESSEGRGVVVSMLSKRETLRLMGRLSIETGIPLFYESSRNYYG